MGRTYGDRVGGFTFEAGVVGGMTAYFIILNVAILAVALSDRRYNPGRFWLAVCSGSVAIGLATMFLAKTKSSLVMIVAAAAGYFVSVWLLNERRVSKQRVLSILIVGGMLLGGFFAWPVLKDTDSGDYLRREFENISLLLNYGFDSKSGAGLNTRIESARLAMYGMFFHPTGVGYTNGAVYTREALDAIVPTPEMLLMYASERYMGFKGYIFNIMGYGGVFGMIALVFMLREAYRSIARSAVPGARSVSIALVVALVALGLTVELLPYVEMVVFSSALAYAWQSQALIYSSRQQARKQRRVISAEPGRMNVVP